MAVLVIALVIATLFAGGALYISLVEHPARRALNDPCMLAQWQPSYRRALPIQSGLALVGSILGFFAWYQTGHPAWVVGAVVLLANWPFTMIAIMPTNKRLMRMTATDAGPESRSLLDVWARLHGVRSALGSLSAALFAWGTIAA